MLPTDDRIRKLTWFQLAEVIWHSRDEHGSVIAKTPADATIEDRFYAKWRAWGLTDEQIEQKFGEFWVIEGERARLEKLGLSADEINRAVAEFESSVIRRRTWGR